LIRIGAKGSGKFRSATWDEALEVIVRRTREEIAQHGGETVLPWSSAGNQGHLQCGSLDLRFFGVLGASQTYGALCGAVASTGYAAVTGSSLSADPLDVQHAGLVLLWGTNTKLTNRHLWPFIERARANGARIVVIDPVRTITAESADWFIQPRSGTDTAMILAMIKVIIDDGLVDAGFASRSIRGLDELAVVASEWTPERAERETGVPAADIVRLARDYSTTRPSFIRTVIGAEHRGNGGVLFSAMTALPGITGQWRHRGGGLSRSVHAWSKEHVDRSVFETSPTSHVRSLPFTQLGRVLTDESLAPAVNVLFVWNGNPVSTCPNATATRKGLMRDDLFTVVSEQFITDTAKYADVVLPAATQIENVDVMPSWGHLYLGWNGKAIDPLGESVANTEMFRRLAKAFGIDDPLFDKSDEELIEMSVRGIDLKNLETEGYVRLPNADRQLFADGVFGHADGKCDVRGISYVSVECDERFPLTLLSPKQHTRFLNTSYSHLPAHGPREGGPYVEMTAIDAAARGLNDGDIARVHNQRGELNLPVRVTDRLGAGLVAVPFGWWDAAHGGNRSVNDLTSDDPTDMGGGVAYHDTFVEVSRA
jgi:anaerobic selenocysteine-containing dehydrogenase